MDLIPCPDGYQQPINQPQITEPLKVQSNPQQRVSLLGRRSIASSISANQTRKRFECRQAMKQLNQVIKNVKEISQKNKTLYENITKKQPNFNFSLFKTNIPLYTVPQEETKLIEQKLLRQLDKLYEENCVLQKQFNKLSFIEQNQQKLQQETQETHLNHYQFLRNVWQNKLSNLKNGGGNSSYSSEEMLEKINKNVASIRSNIGAQLKAEKDCTDIGRRTQIEDQYIVQSQKYYELLKNYERLQMQFQDQKAQWVTNAARGFKTQFNQSAKKGNETESKLSQEFVESLQKKIKQLESQLYKSECQNFTYNEKIKELDLQLKKYRKDDRFLRTIFQSTDKKAPIFVHKNDQHQLSHQQELQPVFEIRIYDREYFADSDKPPRISLTSETINTPKESKREIDCSVDSVIELLENYSQNIHNRQSDDIKLDISLTSIDRSKRESIGLRESLTLIDMNKIVKTDRKSLLKKRESSIGEKARPLRNMTSQRASEGKALQGKGFMPFQLQVQQENSPGFEFPLQNLTIPEFKPQEQNASYMRTKFIRTSTRNKRDSIR